MGKAKTHSGAKKRFKVTGSGKLTHKKTRRRHLLRKRTKKAKRHLRIDAVVRKTEERRMKDLLNL